MTTALSSSNSEALKGKIIVPGDKSISHRALILSSQAVGETRITGLLEGEDVINTKNALKSFGVPIKKTGDVWVVNGVGVGGLTESSNLVDLGNSGTGARLLAGLLSTYNFSTNFTGDESLKKRPMKRVTEPLAKMGAKFSSENLPMTVTGSDNMVSVEYKLPVASAQVKSAILLAALNVPGKTIVIEDIKTRDHTELMMKYLGVDLEIDGNRVTMEGQAELGAKDINVPADPSSAAFPVVAALITPNSDIVVENVCINPLRTGLYKTLLEMGGSIEFLNEREEAGEKIADIKARYSNLKGITVSAERAPSMIDEYPILAIAASRAEGKTVMEGLEELKVKESNRLSAIEEGLKACGIKCSSTNNSLTVEKSESKGGKIKTYMDHRIAMSFLVLGMVSKNSVIIDDSDMINTSFPGFVELMNKTGANVKQC